MGVVDRMARSTSFAAAAAIGGPDGAFAALVAKVVEDLWSDQEQWELEGRVAALEQAIGKDPAAVSEQLDAILGIVARHTPSNDLRRATSCLAVIRVLSTRSDNGLDWDPELEEVEVVEILRGVTRVHGKRSRDARWTILPPCSSAHHGSGLLRGRSDVIVTGRSSLSTGVRRMPSRRSWPPRFRVRRLLRCRSRSARSADLRSREGLSCSA